VAGSSPAPDPSAWRFARDDPFTGSAFVANAFKNRSSAAKSAIIGLGSERMSQLVVRDSLVTPMEDVQELIGDDGNLCDDCVRLETDDRNSEFGEAGFSTKFFMLTPTSGWRLLIDVLSLFVLLYDLCLTPYLIAWDVALEGILYFGALGTTIFWTLDMLASFRTGFYSDGKLEMDARKAAMRYFRTNFLIDIAVLSTDLIGILLGIIFEDEETHVVGSEFLRFAKAGRMLRLAGVFRVSHLGEVFTRLTMRYPGCAIVWNVFQLLAVIIYINHMVACGWYFIGRVAYSDTGGRWIDLPDFTIGSETHTSRESSTLYQYVTAFHFSLTQMTPGSMQVAPVNSIERIFNLSCLLLGLLTFSTLISSLSAMMMDIKKKREASDKQLTVLRRFLRSTGVRRKMAIRLEYVIFQKLWVQRPLTTHDVSALKLLPVKDRTDLDAELSKPFIVRLPILRLCHRVDASLVRKISHEAMDMQYIELGNLMFDSGKEAVGSYIIQSGRGIYTLDILTNGSWTRRDAVAEPIEVEETEWVTEAALWCQAWRHRGVLEPACNGGAGGGAMVMILRAHGFARVVSERKLIRDIVYTYAATFVRLAINASQVTAPMNDLGKSFEGFASYDEILLSWDPNLAVYAALRVYLSSLALHIAREEEMARANSGSAWVFGATGSKLSATLENEVLDSKCNLVVDAAGEVHRVVAVACVQIKRRDTDKIFVNLGRIVGGRVVVDVNLPGMKMKEGSIPQDCLDMLFETGQLRMFDGQLTWEQPTFAIHTKSSKRHGLNTKYIRHIENASVINEEIMDDLPYTFQIGDGLGTTPGGSRRRARDDMHITTSSSVMSPLEPFVTFSCSDEAHTYLSAWVSEKEFTDIRAPEREPSLARFLSELPMENALAAVRRLQAEEAAVIAAPATFV